jgi:hypothetical protein
VEDEDPGREQIERALARPVSDAAQATWGFTNRTDIVTLDGGERVVVQRYRRRADAEYRLRMMRGLRDPAAEAGIRLPQVRESSLDSDPAWVVYDLLPGLPAPEAGEAAPGQPRCAGPGQVIVPGEQVEVVDGGLGGQRGQEVAGRQDVALGGDLQPGGQDRGGPDDRPGRLGVLRDDHQGRGVGSGHLPDELRVLIRARGAGPERLPVGHEVHIRRSRGRAGEGDQRPLGVQQHVEQDIGPRPPPAP